MQKQGTGLNPDFEKKISICICLHFGNVHELCHEEDVDDPHVKEE